MSNTTFYDHQTPVIATWLNDVNTTVYTALGDGITAPVTAAQVRTNLAVPSSASLAASTGAGLVGWIQSGAGAILRWAQDKLRETVSDQDFGLVGDGSDETTKLAAFFTSAVARPGVPHLLRPLTYGITAQLPDINVSNVIVRGAGASIHDVGSLFTGTLIKWIGAAGGTMQVITSISGAGNAKVSNIEFTGIGYDGNSLAAWGLIIRSIKESRIDVAVANATNTGLSLGVVASLGETRDLQKNDIRYVGRQVEVGAGLSMSVSGDATANPSMNRLIVDIQHKNGTAIIESNADNNDWLFCRTFKVAGGTSVEAISWQGGATSAASCREERFHLLSSNVQSQAYGTGTYAVGAANIRIFSLDTGNGTPEPAVQVGASVFWNKVSTPFGDTPWVAYTPAITAYAGAFTTVSATGRYLQRGKICYVEMVISITALGTAATATLASLPFAESASKAWIFAGKETAVTGAMQMGIVAGNASQLSITDYAGNFSGGNGRSISISGFYEIA